MADQCGHRIMAITSAFQADDAGSIPADRSNVDAVMQVAFLFRRHHLSSGQQSATYVVVLN